MLETIPPPRIPAALLRACVVATASLTLLGGVLFPLAIAGVALCFPHQAHGSLIQEDGTVRGSELIGQPFSAPDYFQPRPSAAGKGYDATQSGGSNFAPGHAALHRLVKARARAYRQANGLAVDAPVPADALTASASGLDPHISPENASLQANRVAVARGLTHARVEALVARATEAPLLWVIGQPRVNVLRLNRALDAATPRRRP